MMRVNNIFVRVFAVVLALGTWQAASAAFKSDLILVSPVNVLMRLTTIWTEEGCFSTLLSSFSHITTGFFAGLLSGAVLAVAAGRFKAIEILLRPYMTVIKSVPVASFIIVAIMVFSSVYLSIFISFLMSLPVVYTNLLAGIKNTDKKMTEMADIFGLSWQKRFLYIILPGLRPYILSACSLSVGLAWKSGVAAELIGIPAGSVGEALYYTKVYFDSVDLFAWTVIIVAVSLIFEKLITLLIKMAFAALERKK